jgi:hypothetical protein
MNIIGNWLHHNEVPMGGGVLVIDSKWTFSPDGSAVLETSSLLKHGDQLVNNKANRHVGRWQADGDETTVTIPDHSDSPIKLRFTSDNEISSQKRGVWQRE